MVAQLEAPADLTLTKADVIALVQDRIDAGVNPNAAIVAVYEEIVAQGRLIDLALLHKHQLVGDLWRTWNINHRPAAVARGAKPVYQSDPTAMPSPRVIDVAALRTQSLYDGLYRLNDEWIRLGDMDKTLCHKAFKAYRTAAMADEHNAQYFRLLEAKLEDGQTIQPTFTEAELMHIYRITQPVSQQVPTT